MTWILASSLLLGAVLVTGFAWYERTHPTTRVLALVATLAALAALGRVAFAPLPNVKPTTDIVLIAGYVLGGAPGFMVGAVAALASNLFFGQGPWTPWQMAGWGARRASSARCSPALVGRARSAASRSRSPAALAGLGFGAVMNLHLWVTYSGDHTLAKLAAYFATSLPFDLAHAFGNVVFCLAFGPALVRALAALPAADGGHVAPGPRRRRRGAARRGARAAAAPAAPRRPTPRAPTRRPPRPRCATWRAPRTTTAAGAARPASPRRSCTRAGRRSGWPPRGATRATSAAPPRSTSPARHAAELNDLGELSRTILVFAAAGLSARDVGGRDLVAELLRKRKANGELRRAREHDRVRGARAEGERAARERALRGAGRWIAGQANADGGFNFAGRGGPSGIDDTGAAIQGLAAAGRKRTKTVARAARFLVAPPERRRRLPARAGRRVERAVDRVGDPGPARGRPRPGEGPRARATRSPTCARSRPPRARSATRAPAARRRCG